MRYAIEMQETQDEASLFGYEWGLVAWQEADVIG